MDAVYALLAIVVLLLPFAFLKLWWWFYLTAAITGVVGIFELVSDVKTKHTLSYNFWAWKRQHPKMGWALLGLLGLAWIALLGHLGCHK